MTVYWRLIIATRTPSANGISCIDLGECIVTKPCHRNVQCKNTIGSYNCSCDKGYHGDGTGRYDINECGLKIHNCHEHASCENVAGSFTCVCKSGYKGNGTSCADINECVSGSHQCCSKDECKNLIGSYNCSYFSGYKGIVSIVRTLTNVLRRKITAIDMQSL